MNIKDNEWKIEEEKFNFDVCFFKKGFIFLKCTVCTDFFSNEHFFQKMYGLYVFALKMYGVMYGFFQKCFGHPVYTEVSDLDSSLRLSGTNPKRIFKSCGSKIL